MTYPEALEYIHSVNWVFCKPGLERIRALCHALGDPQDRLRFIHVAGTNGKGSFCAMTDSILRAQGLRVGLFTSPYILHFTERMQIDGIPISEEELCELVETVRPAADAMGDKPTEFELITALAFLYFERHGCDVVVLECGLGGRLDATNIIQTPMLSVITGISPDHTAILGGSIPSIATEKAGIIKPGVPVLWCGTDEQAEDVIRQTADRLGAPFYKADRTRLSVQGLSVEGTVFDFGTHKGLHLPLLGTYQPLNAANALCALELLERCGLPVTEEAIRTGLSQIVWHARFEIIGRDPLVLFDGGHNPEGIDSAVDSIKHYFDGKVAVLTGVMADKEYPYMANQIASVAEQVFCVTPNNPRALSAKDYAACFTEIGVPALPCPSVAEAVAQGGEYARQRGVPLVCLGSLYMYGEVVQALKKQE